MDSTIIAILLASAVIFWKAPFSSSFIPLVHMLHRRWRQAILVILLLAVTAVPTHIDSAASQTETFAGEKPLGTCR